jgi:hypothetical protein
MKGKEHFFNENNPVGETQGNLSTLGLDGGANRKSN